jgi:hypothetical protein
MSEPGVRPGGLTALAVINFVWAAFELMAGAFTATSPVTLPLAVAQAEKDLAAESRPEKRDELARGVEQLKETNDVVQKNPGLAIFSGGVEGFLGLLLVVAGIGYLKLRRFLGRTLGVVYAIIAVCWEIAFILYVQKHMDQTPGIFALIGFIYPAVTIFALLVTFRDDFVNP